MTCSPIHVRPMVAHAASLIASSSGFWCGQGRPHVRVVTAGTPTKQHRFGPCFRTQLEADAREPGPRAPLPLARQSARAQALGRG